MTTNLHNQQLLANRYRLVELIGKGAMGRVFRAEDTLLGGVTVAVKFLSQTLLSERIRSRFEQEATICALLGEKSIHIVRVRDYGVDSQDVPFYVMELLEGKSLNELIRYQPLALPRFLLYSRHICLGLESAHEGVLFKGERCQVIHRDIKPSNMLVVNDPSFGKVVKILDFGVAKLIQPDHDQTHTFMGTLAYASPEQIEGEELDPRSDIYSFGVMMYEMLSAEMPLLPDNRSFGGWYKAHREEAPHPFNPDLKIPQGLQDLVMQCLAKIPRDRPQNIREILQVLETLEANLEKEQESIQRQALAVTNLRPPRVDSSTDLLDQLCLKASWPADKPQQEIVFPNLIRPKAEEILPTLWAMLKQNDIELLDFSTRYNQFLCVTAPHPMLLWITVLYNGRHAPRWLPCYLDLKTQAGQKVARTLGVTQSYRVLFFSIEDAPPQHCKQVIPMRIDPAQSQMLIDWANSSQIIPGGQSQLSKQLLKQELEKLKPKILRKLDAIYITQGSGIKS